MGSFMLCTCPPEPPHDYGRGWTLRGTVWICSRCDGEARPDQQPTIDDALRVALRQMTSRTRA